MKRLWLTVGMIFGLALLFIVGLGVILILSPGSRIFGIQYVSAFVGKNDVSEEYSEYIDGDIFVTTRDIPVIIDVQPYGRTKIEFSQHYHGYTLDRVNIPNCKITRTASGIEVKTSEVVKFLLGGNDAHYLKITVPYSWATSGQHSIYVNGENSPITLQSADDVTLKFVDLTFNANNALNLNAKVVCKNLTAFSKQKQVFNDKVSAENYDITTINGNLTFNGEIEGNLKVKTTSGSVYFKKVKGNAVITTGNGEVAGIDNINPIIYGNATIETGRGRVVIDELLGDSNHIKTAGGSITINTVLAGNIESARGAITIDSFVSGTINGGVKDVTVKSVSTSATIASTKGNVYVGEDATGKTAKNIKVSSTNGKITAKNTIGSVEIYSSNGDIVLDNKSATSIKINGAKTVTATGLLGSVDVSAQNDIYLTFRNVSGNVNVNGSARCHNINIKAEHTNYNDVNVYLETTKGGNASVYRGESLLKQGLKISPETEQATLKTIKVNAPNCQINLYLKAA